MASNGFFSFLGGNRAEQSSSELPDIFPLALKCNAFRESDIIATYMKILTDAMERTHGLKDKFHPLLWDNCVQTETNQGLIHLLACAMYEKKELFLVYLPSVDVLRKADSKEESEIREDYKKSAKSSKGVYISFKNYRVTEMLTIYSDLEYCVLASLHKGLNLSKALQIKISKLRDSVSLADSSIAQGQAKTIAEALGKGKDIFCDKEDEITSATPDTATSEKSIGFIDSKRAFILGLPLSYISGLQTGGLNATGEADTNAIERGLKLYYSSIIQPVLKALFDAETEFKSQDFRGMTSNLEVLKTFQLTDETLITMEGKREIIQRVFDLDPEKEEKARAKEEKEAEQAMKDNPPPAPGVVDPNAPPPVPGQAPAPAKAPPPRRPA